LDPSVLPIAGSRTPEHIPNARQELGIGGDGRIALLFGSAHRHKDPDLVWRTFAHLSDWQLLAGGPVADTCEPHLRARFVVEPILFPGFVDPTLRDTLFAAADVVVLSFNADYQLNSGTLMDALSWGLPVVCSQGSRAGEIVDQFGLGATFEPGVERSLADALRRVPARIDPDGLEAARQSCSNLAVAQSHLRALDAGAAEADFATSRRHADSATREYSSGP
jgi:glycosyltransferase involved in cell wall biosynthesis